MNAQKPLEHVNQIEKSELALTKLNAARSLVPVARELDVFQAGRSIVLRDQSDPSSMYYNRIKGFGPIDLPDIDKLLRYYEPAVPCWDMTPDRLTEEVSGALCERGFIPVEQLAFLYAYPGEEQGEGSSFQIEQVNAETSEEFIRWIEQSKGGVPFSREVIERCEPYFYRPDFKNYMLRIDGNPAAMGSLFLHEQAGYLANDYTFPDYRGRGCQLALIHRRLSDAAKLGMTAVYTDVEFGSVSHGNMEKAGFRLSFLNTFWVAREK